MQRHWHLHTRTLMHNISIVNRSGRAWAQNAELGSEPDSGMVAELRWLTWRLSPQWAVAASRMF